VITIQLANQQTDLPVDEARMRRAVEMILEDESISEALVSVAVVDDATIRRLNRRYLDHDWATDVLSFVLEQSNGWLEGEVVVGAQTAQRAAAQYGWPAADELLLYLIHGVLHLVGCDDRAPDERAAMRSREKKYLARFGLDPRYEESERSDGGTQVP
jgi:probable rRNA maturation factor